MKSLYSAFKFLSHESLHMTYDLLYDKTLFFSYQKAPKRKITCSHPFEIKAEGSNLIIQALTPMGKDFFKMETGRNYEL